MPSEIPEMLSSILSSQNGLRHAHDVPRYSLELMKPSLMTGDHNVTLIISVLSALCNTVSRED